MFFMAFMVNLIISVQEGAAALGASDNADMGRMRLSLREKQK
jgi:hypothetical protein